MLYSGLDRSRREELFLNRGFAFQSAAWWEASLVFVELDRVWRQKDAHLVATLNRVRKGAMTADDCAFLNTRASSSLSMPNLTRGAPLPSTESWALISSSPT